VATVELRFTALPAHVRTARLVAVSLARRAGIEDEVLDEVRLAVGEAATRAVGRHEVACPAELVLVRLTDDNGQFVAEVVDRAAETDLNPSHLDPSNVEPSHVEPSHVEPSHVDPSHVDPSHLDPSEAAKDLHLVVDAGQELPPGVDLAVIGGLVDDLTVMAGSEGSVVRMAWPVVSTAAQGQGAHPVDPPVDLAQPAK
jgi:serine/threonine-protein kinase RsbW